MNYINLFSAFVVSICQSVREFVASIDRWVTRQHSSSFSFSRERSRGLMIEPLESRELLAANILDLGAYYASPDNDAVVTFDLSTYRNEAMVFDVTAQSGGTFDPGDISIFGSNGQPVSPLSSISTASDTTTTGRFLLSGGTYTIKVASDEGTLGNFNLSLAVADDVAGNKITYDPMLKDLIAVTLAQKTHINWYDYLTNAYPHLITKYGVNAFKGDLLKQFPEMDMNGNGVVDSNDKELAIAVANSVNNGNSVEMPLKTATIKTPPTTTTPSIVDTDGPAITIALQNDTGYSQNDKLTTDPTLNVTITDPRTVKHVQVSAGGGQTFVDVPVSENNNYTFTADYLKTLLNVNDLVGDYTFTVKATDGFGNVSSSSFTFTAAPPIVGIDEQPPSISNSNESVIMDVFEQPSFATGAAITQVNGKDVVSGRVELNKGYVIVDGNTAAFYTDGKFLTLNSTQTEDVTLKFTVADNAGNSITVEKTVTINGSNQKPELIFMDDNTIVATVYEGDSVDITFEELLDKWNDSDSETLTPVNFVVDSVVNSPANLKTVFTTDVLSEFVIFSDSKLTFYATDEVFSQLAVGESVVVRLKYNVSDGELESDTFGYVEITINGVNQPPTVTKQTFAASSFTTEGSITFRHDELLEKYGVIDDDVSDSGKHFIQSVVSYETNHGGIEIDVNTDQDGKVVDVTISASDELQETLRLGKSVTGSFTVTISDGSGGTVEAVLSVEIIGVADKLEVTYNSESSWFVDTCEGDKAALNELDEDTPDFTLLLPSNVAGEPKIMIANLFSVTGITADDKVTYSINSENGFLAIDNDGNLIVDYSKLDGTDIPYVQTVTATINDDETVEFTFLVNFETVEIVNVDDEFVIDLNSGIGLPHKIVQTPTDAKSGEFAVVDGSSELVITSINDNEKTYDELLPTFEEGVDYELEVDADGFVSLTWLNLDKFKFLPEDVVAKLNLSFTLQSGEFEYKHLVTLAINGVNDVPVISNVPENLELEINGKTTGSNIELGQLTITDADNDTVETECGPVFYIDETSSEPVAIDVTAFVDADGKIYINFTTLPDIEPGHSLDCWFTVTFDDDKTNGTTSKIINVKLTSAPAPNVEIKNPEIVKFNETTKPKNVVFDIEVSDASSYERTGNKWYKIENCVVDVVRSDSDYQFTEAFNTSKDLFFTFEPTEFGQQLRFKVTNANIFNFLNDGEILTLTYTFDVTDIEKDVTTTKSVTVIIHGENTLPTYNVNNIDVHNTSIGENDSVTLDVLSIWTDADSAHTKKTFDIVGPDGTGLPVVTVKSVNNTNAFEVDDVIDGLITITTKANGVKQITFTPGTTFDALAVGAIVELEIMYKVFDSVAVSEKTGVVILTINGTNDEPTISVGELLDDVSWTGREQGDKVVVGTFDTDDIDGDKLTTTVVEGTTEVLNGEEWLATDDVEFTIVDNKINITFVNKLDLSNGESAKYRFKLQTSDGNVTTETDDYAEVNVTTLYNPVVDDIDVTVNESNAQVSEAIIITDKNDSGHKFSIDNLVDAKITYSNDELYENADVDLTDCFSIENKTFMFNAGEKFVFLNNGDSVTITFTYTVTDSVYEELTTTGTITVTINGVNSAPIYVAPGEDVAIPEINANASDIELSPLDNWTDPDLSPDENKDNWSVVSPDNDNNFAAVIVGRSKSMDESAAFDDKFVNGKSYNDLVMFVDGKLVFIPDNVFVGLREGDYVDLEISYRVVDADGAVSKDVQTERVRVNGVNDPMSVEVIDDTFNISTSITNADPSQVLPTEFIVSDDDIGEVVTFEIKEVTGTDSDYWDSLTDEVKEKLFTIDSSTGKVTIDISLLEDLPAGNDLTFTLEVRASNTSGDTSDNTLTIKVTSPNPPKVISGGKNVTESEVAEEIRINLNELISDANLPSRTGNDWYSITDVEVSIDGFDIAGKWSFDSLTNEIVLNTGDTFASLAEGVSAVITFKFTVNDNDYSRSTNGETTLTITGENDTPTQLNEIIDFGTITVGGKPRIIKISDYFTDIDNGDHIRVTAINGSPLDDGEVTISNVGKFVYDDEEGTLSYYSDDDSDFFWNISVKSPETIKFTITVADEQDAELIADATVEVHGINAQPIVKIPSYEIYDGNRIVIKARDIASDRNIGDTLTFVSVGGADVTSSTQIEAESGITITFSNDLTEMYFNRSALLGKVYQETSEGARVSGTYESLILSIVVQDDSGEENAVSNLGNITFVIKGVGSEAGGDDDIIDGDNNVGNVGGNTDDNLGDDNEPELENGETLLLDDTPTDKQEPEVTDKENQSFDKKLDPDGKKQTVGQIDVDGSNDSYTYERVTGSFTLDGRKITNPGFTINADGTITIAKGKLGNFADGKYQFAVIVTAEDGTSYRVNVTVNITVTQTATDYALASFALYDDLFHVDYSDELKKNNKETADKKSDDEDVIDKVFAEFYDEQLRNTA